MIGGVCRLDKTLEVAAILVLLGFRFGFGNDLFRKVPANVAYWGLVSFLIYAFLNC